MSIVIDKSRCAGCGQCSIVCPGSLIKMGEDKKAYIKYPKDCWGCSSCLKECRVRGYCTVSWSRYGWHGK